MATSPRLCKIEIVDEAGQSSPQPRPPSKPSKDDESSKKAAEPPVHVIPVQRQRRSSSWNNIAKKTFFIIALLITTIPGIAYVSQSPWGKDSPLNLKVLHKHVLRNTGESDADVNARLSRIDELRSRIRREELELYELSQEMQEVKRNHTWFFDLNSLVAMQKLETQANDKQRNIERLEETISTEMTSIKPLLHGRKRLEMLVKELTVMYVRIFFFPLRWLLLNVAVMSLFSWLCLGPAVMVIIWLVVGAALSSYFCPIVLASVCVRFLFEFPVVLVSYNPSVLEFLGVYLCVLVTAIAVIKGLWDMVAREEEELSGIIDMDAQKSQGVQSFYRRRLFSDDAEEMAALQQEQKEAEAARQRAQPPSDLVERGHALWRRAVQKLRALVRFNVTPHEHAD